MIKTEVEFLRIKLNRLVEKFWMWLAWHLPKELVKWSGVRLVAHATQGEYSDTVVPELTAMDALERWGN
jgi:hypothetical protein